MKPDMFCHGRFKGRLFMLQEDINYIAWKENHEKIYTDIKRM
jgi:hypothetical protein